MDLSYEQSNAIGRHMRLSGNTLRNAIFSGFIFAPVDNIFAKLY
jgi:hypothetical protein